MLRQLALENFKGLKKAEIDFGRITVLIGPNGTGKSSISQALMVLKQSIGYSSLRPSGPLVDLGDFDSILNKETSLQEIGIRLNVKLISQYAALDIPKGASFFYHARFNHERLTRLDAAIGTSKKKYLTAKISPSGRKKRQREVEPEQLVLRYLDTEVLLGLEPNEAIAIPVNVSTFDLRSGRRDVGERCRDQVTDLFSTINRLLNDTYLVPAIRGLDKPDYPLLDVPASDFAPGANAQLASTFAYGGQDLADIVSVWSETITGSEIGFRLIPQKRVAVSSYAVPGGIPVIGDGFGTNQLVQLLLTLATTPNNSVIAIEEPEIHLHPAAQKKLCNLIVEIAKAQEKQIVLTTHSEHVLFGFISAVREDVLTRDELAMYYFEEKGTEPRRIDQDEHADIYDWGRHFFALP